MNGKRELWKLLQPSEPVSKVFSVTPDLTKPTDEQLAKINQYTIRPYTQDELYIRRMKLANDQTDRDYERFDRGHLERFAETIVGKSVLVGHNHSTASIGRFFGCDIEVDEKGWTWIAPWFYMVKANGNELERQNIDAGIWSYVSIGSLMDYNGLVCEICGKPYWGAYGSDISSNQCRHILGSSYDGVTATAYWDSKQSDMSKVEAVEGSIVYIGSQYEAAIAKSAERDKMLADLKKQIIDDSTEEPGGEMEEVNMEELKKLKSDLDAMTTRSEELETAKKELESKVAELTAKAEAGEQYATDLKTEITRIGKLLDEERSTTFLTESISEVAKLKEVLDEYKKRLDVKFPPTGEGVTPSGTEGTDEAPVTIDRSFRVV